MNITSFDGTSIWYDHKKKSDTTLIFIHDWATNWTVWEKEIGFLSATGFSTVALDLRGHGQSDKPEEKEKYTMDCFAKDIYAIVEKEQLKNIVLIGHSMGGMIALEYYKLFHDTSITETTASIQAIILCDTTFTNVFEHKQINTMSPFVKHVLDHLIEHEDVKKKHFSHMEDIDLNTYKNASDYRVYYEGLHNTSMKSVFACMESMMNCDLTSVLPEIDIPVLIIEGAEDKVLPKLDSIELYDEISSSEIDFVPKGKHFVNLKSPKEVDTFIWNFLQKHEIV